MPDVSVVLPVYNEADCIEAVMRELFAALSSASPSFEVLAVNDGSSDSTPGKLAALQSEFAALRVLHLTPNSGQSAAFEAGFRAAKGSIIVTIDADGQNDPRDITKLLERLHEADCVCGYRENRQDTAGKRNGSKLANAIRNRVLHENIIDTGCSLKAFRAETVRDLVMWKGMHRFLGTFVAMRGGKIIQIPVNHRPRVAGESKYTNWGRLKKTIWDLLAVKWMKSRYTPYAVTEDKP